MMESTATRLDLGSDQLGFIGTLRKKFPGRVPVYFSRGGFTIKTAATRKEFLQVLKLRYDVFHREYKNRRFPFGFDKDRYDLCADYLMIIDDKTQKLVGTYRLINSEVTSEFYSRSEFNIAPLTCLPGIKVELSRACIQKDYRNGVVIALLWRGLVEYVRACGAKYLFGLASVKTTDVQVVAGVYKTLQQMGAMSPGLTIEAQPEYAIAGFRQVASSTLPLPINTEYIPTLLRAYLKAGAKVYGEPVVDAAFNCTDFFMILDLDLISSQYERKFLVN